MTDDSAFRTHLDRAPAVVKAHGGRYLVRGGAHEVIRGNGTPDRLIVVEFDSVQQAREWQDAPHYADLGEKLNKFSETNGVIVEGV